MDVDLARCRIQTPDGVIERARFLFRGGTAAAWIEDRRLKTAARVLYAQGAEFVKARKASENHRLILGETGEEWLIRSQPGGCACANKATRSVTVEQLLSADMERIG